MYTYSRKNYLGSFSHLILVTADVLGKTKICFFFKSDSTYTYIKNNEGLFLRLIQTLGTLGLEKTVLIASRIFFCTRH